MIFSKVSNSCCQKLAAIKVKINPFYNNLRDFQKVPFQKIQFCMPGPDHKGEIHFFQEKEEETLPRVLFQTIPNRAFGVIDEKVYKLYPHLIQSLNFPFLKLPAGEMHKTLATVEKITLFLQQYSCRRQDLLIVIGGGCIGDTAGFAASLYKRGISWVYCPTTLISQADSSIGGKVAVNTAFGKNLLGAFWPPQKVYIAPSFLKTLDSCHYKAGLAEIIKVALLANPSLLADLKEKKIGEIIRQSVQTKLKIIGEDWLEKKEGGRAALNFGHTIGHALEKIIPQLLHGEAVAIGMVVELFLASAKGEKVYSSNHLSHLLSHFNLPTLLPDVVKEKWDEFEKALFQDKKNITDNFSLIVPTQQGKIKKIDVTPAELKKNLF